MLEGNKYMKNKEERDDSRNQNTLNALQGRIVHLNPFRCCMWEYHDRLDEFVTAESCAETLKSIQMHGQQMPVLGRPLEKDSTHDVELLYGARRLYAARKLKRDLLVRLAPVTDREAAIYMDIENRARTDISAYERGLSYQALLRGKHFASQQELAKALGVSEARVSRLLKFAALPLVIVRAFQSPLEIREAWAVSLVNEIGAGLQHKRRIIASARILQKSKESLTAEKTYQALMAGQGRGGRKLGEVARDRVVPDANGKPLFRISRRHSDVHIVLPRCIIDEMKLERIAGSIQSLLSSTEDSHCRASGSNR